MADLYYRQKIIWTHDASSFILRYPVRLFTWVLTGIAVITIVSALVLLYGCLAVSLLFQRMFVSPERLAAVAILAVIMSSVQFF
ncbi:hypothetical protein PO124_15390 [Bacillus licheniformis]|nr:hypothetical protein [Bacillus licheniformis]